VRKNDFAHNGLAAQIKEHKAARVYETVVCGGMKEDSGRIEAPIGRNPSDRKKMAVTDKNARSAVTNWRVLERFRGIHTWSAALKQGAPTR
jgi:23S rRNA pseudouridine1911/1915/1917 synthase